MSGWDKWGIRRKLFSVILLILAANIVVLVFMGSTLFEHFYRLNKISELEKSARLIRTAYAENSETFFTEVSRLENENTFVSIVSYAEDGSLEDIYQSRPARGGWKSPQHGLPSPAEGEADEARKQALLERIKNTDDSLSIKELDGDGKGGRGEDITLSTKLDENLYLYMQTPRGYIKSTADLAVKYTAFLSICILLGGAAVIYFVSGRVTKPIRRIQEAAERISRMDFSQACETAGGDEISMLAASINQMSGSLQTSIEKLVQANEVLQNDLVRQQQTDRMRREFVANVSHDFKTPLTLMISYAEALSAETLSDGAREYCYVIVSEGNKLSRMVGRLLGLSKLESGADSLEKSIFCLNEVLDEVIKSQRILAQKRGISVEKHYGDAFIVRADYQKIVQVVTNLYENAVKYVPEGGLVSVSTEKRGAVCRVCVENTGAPIAEEDRDSLFDSFYRADKSRASGQSYGLGLAIVKAVMETHRQACGVENSVDGVRFWFELELADFD